MSREARRPIPGAAVNDIDLIQRARRHLARLDQEADAIIGKG